MQKTNLQEGVRKLWVGPIPLGWLLTSRTRWSKDDGTSEAREQLNETLEHSGAAILDSHTSKMDIVAAAALLSQIDKVESVVAPVAGYLYYAPLLQHSFFEKLNEQVPIKAMPVFRAEEQGTSGRKVRNRSGMSREKMLEANEQYLATSTTATHTPHQLSIIAPYGTRHREGQKLIRGGVAEVLKSSCPAFCTLAMFDWSSLQYVVGMSNLLPTYNGEATRREMTADIAGAFSDLRDQIR